MSVYLDSATGQRFTLCEGQQSPPQSSGATRIFQIDDCTYIHADENGHVFGILSTRDLLGEPNLFSRIRESIAAETPKTEEEPIESFDTRFSELTAREREVAELLVAAKHPKLIAKELGVSPKTVEFHRSNVLRKMSVDSVVELTRLMLLKANT